MAQDNRIRMPNSGAGITSFSEDHHSKLSLTPTGVLVYVAVLVAAVVLLRVVA
jgi:preprotein translocase subunit Sec61beta